MSLYRMTPAVAALLADPSAEVFLVLPSGHHIRLEILMRAERFVPTMEYGRDYKLREMAGAEWWDTLPLWHRITGGETYAFLVAHGAFHLEFACHPERSNKTYKRV